MSSLPFYTCTAPEGWLTADQRRDLVRAIVRVHATATRAPRSFVHTQFLTTTDGDQFIGEDVARFLRVDGRIRAGRPLAVKQRIVREIARACAQVTGRPVGAIAVSVTEIPAQQSLENGRIMPEPGAEREWFESQGPSEDGA